MLNYTQLEALLAVEETGTFEEASRSLNLSSFAVVQRIKTLEAKLGVVLVERGPTRISEAGKILCDHARDVRALEDDLVEQHRLDCLDAASGRPTLKIAINDERLSNWFFTALSDHRSSKDRPRLDVQLASHDQIVEQMRTGEIIAALTCHSQTVYGCKTYELGAIAYLAVASPAYMEKFFQNGVTDKTIPKAPCLRFCGNDASAHDWTRQQLGKAIRMPVYRHPSAQGSLRACLEGQAWTMQPHIAIGDHLADGSLVELVANSPVRRTLYWHVAGAMADAVRPITGLLQGTDKHSPKERSGQAGPLNSCL